MGGGGGGGSLELSRGGGGGGAAAVLWNFREAFLRSSHIFCCEIMW